MVSEVPLEEYDAGGNATLPSLDITHQEVGQTSEQCSSLEPEVNTSSLDSTPNEADAEENEFQDPRNSDNYQLAPRRMVALFDYDPQTLSPNPDSDVGEYSLPFLDFLLLLRFFFVFVVPVFRFSFIFFLEKLSPWSLILRSRLQMPCFASWFRVSSSFVCVGCVCVRRKNKGDQKGVGNNLFIYLFSHLFYQVELKFKVGDVIYVYGDMDEDGFYTVSLYFFPLLSYTAV